MNKKTITALKLIEFAELGMAIFLCWVSYHFDSTMEKPVASMRVTFEMYQAQFTFINLFILQLLPSIAGFLFFLRRGNFLLFEKGKPAE